MLLLLPICRHGVMFANRRMIGGEFQSGHIARAVVIAAAAADFVCAICQQHSIRMRWCTIVDRIFMANAAL